MLGPTQFPYELMVAGLSVHGYDPERASWTSVNCLHMYIGTCPCLSEYNLPGHGMCGLDIRGQAYPLPHAFEQPFEADAWT